MMYVYSERIVKQIWETGGLQPPYEVVMLQGGDDELVFNHPGQNVEYFLRHEHGRRWHDIDPAHITPERYVTSGGSYSLRLVDEPDLRNDWVLAPLPLVIVAAMIHMMGTGESLLPRPKGVTNQIVFCRHSDLAVTIGIDRRLQLVKRFGNSPQKYCLSRYIRSS